MTLCFKRGSYSENSQENDTNVVHFSHKIRLPIMPNVGHFQYKAYVNYWAQDVIYLYMLLSPEGRSYSMNFQETGRSEGHFLFASDQSNPRAPPVTHPRQKKYFCGDLFCGLF